MSFKMGAFHRQPSRMWWDSDPYSNPYFRPHNHIRTQSSSPRSQDSGFSDTETSPTNTNNKVATSSLSSPNITDVDISVNVDNVTTIKVKTPSSSRHVAKTDIIDNNLVENVREKETPAKSNLKQLFEERYRNGGPGPGTKSVSPKATAATPSKGTIGCHGYTDPAPNTHRYSKCITSSNVNRNLFNQYATNNTTATTNKQQQHVATHNNANEDEYPTTTKDNSPSDISITRIPEETQSQSQSQSPPNITSNDDGGDVEDAANLTAPAILPAVQFKLNQADLEFCQSDVGGSESKDVQSECDSEIEELFPAHTSTPKQDDLHMKRGRLGMNLHKLKRRQEQRVPPFNIDEYRDASLKAWYTDISSDYEGECMTALQGKSITGELTDRVAKLAAEKTNLLCEIIHDAIGIYHQIDSLDGQLNVQPHCSTLSTYMRSYLTKHGSQAPIATSLRHHCLELSTLKSTAATTAPNIAQLTADFTAVHRGLLIAQARQFIRTHLLAPQSEVDVRAVVTGLTSVCLHYAEQCARRGIDLIGAFVIDDDGAVELLVRLCEICEGSSVRRAILRALATVCAQGAAVRRFERSGGVDKAIVDVVTDDALPEVERIEAIALLAQITAPWIDPPCSLPSIRPHLRFLIRSLTVFAHTNNNNNNNSSCKQSLLLCCAALANLTTLYIECVRHIIAFRSIDVLLKCLRMGSKTADTGCDGAIEIYVLEQVAIVLTNVSATEEGRSYLTATPTTCSALVCFLETTTYHRIKSSESDDELAEVNVMNACACDLEVAVVQRLQQKAIIALSRLCGDAKAAQHVVQMGGVRRLVTLCREKEERYGSDAVLVAALATLRKISETCGAAIMTEDDMQELITPRLLDSFLAYSAQNESLV